MSSEVAVVERQAKLVADVRELAGTRKLGARFQAEIAEHLQTLQQAVEALRALHDMLDLSDLELELGGRRANREYWRQLQPGRYQSLPSPAANTADNQAKAEQMRALYKSKSLTLNTLYKASLDINAVTKFSDFELEFAKGLGERFKDLKKTWANFKRLQTEQRPLHFKWHSYRSGRDFFELLLKNQVIESYGFSLQVGGGERQQMDRQGIEKAISDRKIKDAEHKIWIEYKGLNTKLIPLVTGHWFEAYTYTVFDDTLSRLADDDYEIYSRVEFEAKEHLRERSKSDFDILVGLPDQIIMAECKSGTITKEACQQMKENATLLRRIFTRMGVHKFLFLLVFNPTEDAEQFPLLTDLTGAGFVVVEPYNITPFLNAHIQNQLPQEGVVWAPPADMA